MIKIFKIFTIKGKGILRENRKVALKVKLYVE